MRRSLMLIPAIVPAAAMLFGALPTESSFNGTYSGSIAPTPGMSAASCTTTPITAKVDNGRISAPDMHGYVNVKAFVTGKVKTADGRSLPIEGRVEEEADNQVHLSAGAIDEQSGCAWTIDLVRQSQR